MSISNQTLFLIGTVFLLSIIIPLLISFVKKQAVKKLHFKIIISTEEIISKYNEVKKNYNILLEKQKVQEEKELLIYSEFKKVEEIVEAKKEGLPSDILERYEDVKARLNQIREENKSIDVSISKLEKQLEIIQQFLIEVKKSQSIILSKTPNLDEIKNVLEILRRQSESLTSKILEDE